jgi:hypothetical protein
MNSRDKGIKEVPQFIDSDDKWRKCLLIDSDEEGTADFIKIDYLTEKYKTHHANKKLQDDFKEIEDGISCTHSAAPSKFESTSIAADANDEARSHSPPNTVASTAPGKSASILDASCANETGKYNIHPYPHSSELPQAKASLINATTTATPQPITTTTTSDIEIALARTEVELTKETDTKEKIRHKMHWKVPVARYAYNPPETEDEQEAYGQYMIQGKFSISEVLPEQRPWIPADQWTIYPRKAHTRKHYNDEGRAKWKERYLASRHMKDDAIYHLARAKRSALIMSLDIDVGTGTLPKKWPAVIKGPKKYTYGLCDLPPFEDYETYRKRICYVNEPPMRSFSAQ